MSTALSNNTRILKNTIFLYFRMFIVTLVSIYTVRVVLNALGQEDYGIYNLIGGIVGFLGFITSTLTSATQRFLSFELGKGGDNNRFSSVFSISIELFVVLAIAIAIICEIALPDIIRNNLVIPPGRLEAALNVLHFSIATFCLSLVTIPFSASIIAYEKMSMYAYISIFEAIGKLAIVFILQHIEDDKLIAYSYLTLAITLLITAFNGIFCHIKLPLCRFSLQWDKTFNKKFVSFIGWNSFGAITSIFTVQGLTLILNIFWGPLANAAKAIADRINAVIQSLVTNFVLAASPQETKLMAAGEQGQMLQIFYSISKLSFFLIFVIAVPATVLMPEIIVLWLGADETSPLMVIFSQITMVGIVFTALECPMSMLVRATGDVKEYQISCGLISIMTLPLTIIAYKLGAPIYSFCIIQCSVLFISLFIRVKVIKKLFAQSLSYYKQVILPILKVVCPSLILLMCVTIIKNDLLRTILICALPILCTVPLIYFVGITSKEKKYVRSLLKLHRK